MKVEGRGSVEQLEKDKPRGKCRKWRLWVRSGGKNHSRRFNGAYREALKALEDFKAEIEAIVPNADTFKAYADKWVEYRSDSGNYEVNTMAKDRRCTKALSMAMGGLAMDAITPEVCRDALTRIKHGENATGRELSNTSMRELHVCLNMIMQQAEDDGRIAANPMRRIKPPKIDTPEREALSAAELGLFLNRLDELPLNCYVMACYLMACLGLRRGEACALMDADVHDGIALVRFAVKESNGKLGPPKSDAGIRTLPVPPRLEAKIAEWRIIREENGYPDAPTLACNFSGGILRPQNLYRWWHGQSGREGACEKLGCPGMVLHDLRHSNLTMMARHLTPFDLQRYAGWSSLEPARIYVHEDLASVTRGVTEAWKVMA